jgi:PmbA protein
MDYDTIKEELLSEADTGLKFAKSLDSAAEVELFIVYENTAESEIGEGIVTAKDGARAGNSARVAKNNRVGFASSSGISAERIKRSIKEAYAVVTSVNVEDRRFKSLPDPKPPGVEADFDKAILGIEISSLIEDCNEMIDEAKAVDERITFATASASTTWGGYAVANTHGILNATRYGNSACSVNVQAKQNEERRNGLEFDVASHRVYEKEGLSVKASENALGLLDAMKYEVTEKMSTIWTPFSAATYFLASLGQSVLGEPVVEGTSPLCDMIGDMIGPKNLNVWDDGQAKQGLGTRSVDGEGLPQQRTPIIDNGVLRSFLFDSYFGAAFGVESTGNSERSGGLFGGNAPYENSPSVSTKFLQVSPGTKSLDDLISSTDGKAIMIFDFPIGIFHGSVSTGEFSAVAASAFLVENGEKVGPIEPVSVAGNFYEGFRNLISIGSDQRVFPYGIATPSLVIDGFSVTCK